MHGQGKGDPEKVRATTEPRAEAIKRYLVEHGVDEARLTATGRGLDVPVVRGRRSKPVERIELEVKGLVQKPAP